MKRLSALVLFLSTLLSCFVGCSVTIKEYNETPLTSLTYTHVDYNGGFTTEYFFDFYKNTVTLHSYLPTDDEHDRMETLSEFTDEQEKILINKIYTYGLFDIREEYKSPPGIIDGGGWTLKIDYSDGTSKVSRGSNNSPSYVFSKCAEAFYDICGDGVVTRVSPKYHTPPNLSYSIDTIVGNHNISQGATSLAKRGNYKWNGFEENSLDIFELNQSNVFPFELDENAEHKFVLYTANYGDYDRFRKCVVVSYDYNEELSGEEVVVEKGWFSQIEFDLQPDKIYVIKLSFKDGDFVEYTFNTKMD